MGWAVKLHGDRLCNGIHPCTNVMSCVEHLHCLNGVTQTVTYNTTPGDDSNVMLTANKSDLLKKSEHLLTLCNRQSTKRPIVHGLGNVYIKKKLVPAWLY